MVDDGIQGATRALVASKNGSDDEKRYTYVDVLERVSDGVQVRIVGRRENAEGRGRERGDAADQKKPPPRRSDKRRRRP